MIYAWGSGGKKIGKGGGRFGGRAKTLRMTRRRQNGKQRQDQGFAHNSLDHRPGSGEIVG
jgi:hypothetical protein